MRLHPQFILTIMIAVVIACLPSVSHAQEDATSRNLPLGLRQHAVQFQQLGTEDGLPSVFAFAVVKDQQGFLWFGTLDGLARYDGYEMTVYTDDSSPFQQVRSGVKAIYPASTGGLWISTREAGVYYFDPSTESFSHYRHDPDDPTSLGGNRFVSPTTIYEDERGGVWFGTDNGLSYFDPFSQIFVSYRHDLSDPHSLPHNQVWAIEPDRVGNLWVATADGLSHFNITEQRFVTYRYSTSSNNIVAALHRAADGTVWLGTQRGLYHFDPTTERFTPHRFDNATNSLSANDITVLEASQQEPEILWVGSGGGLHRFHTTQGWFETYQNLTNDPTSLSNNLIRDVYEDDTGILWVATGGGGVNIYDPLAPKFDLIQHHPNQPNSLSHNYVTSLTQADDGVFWVATNGGGLNRFDPQTGQFTTYQHEADDPTSLSSNSASKVYVDRLGLIWVHTFGGGLNRFDPTTEQVTRYHHDATDPTSLGSNVGDDILEDETGALWVTGINGVSVFDRDTERFRHHRHDSDDPTSLSNNAVWSLYKDHNGTMWVSTGNGLSRYEAQRDQFTRFTPDANDPDSLTHPTVTHIYQATDGRYWVTGYGGLAEFEPTSGRFTYHTTGLASLKVQSSLEDEQGTLWLGTEKGVSRFDPRTETFRNYTSADGLQRGGFHYQAFYKDGNGALYLGGSGGLNLFYPDQVVDNPYLPPVYLTKFEINRTPVSIGGDSPLSSHIIFAPNLTLTPRDAVLSFEFTALNYRAPQQNQYAYKLDGFDEQWTQTPSNRRFATYTNLDPGTYTFRVRGSNNDGLWNEAGVALAITVVPPWWQTEWAYTLYVVAFIGLMLAYAQYRVYLQKQKEAQIERQNQLLQDLVTQQTAQLRKFYQAVEQSGNTIFFTDLQGNIEYVNQAFVKKTGYSSAEVIGKTPRLLQSGHHTPEFYQNMWRALYNSENWQGEILNRNKDGMLYWELTHITPLLDEQGKLTHFICIREDITTRKEMEAALAEAKQKAEAANQAKSLFLANMSHELRSPLTTILGFVDLLKRTASLPAEDVENLNIVRRSGEHLLLLINEVLDLSKIEAGRMTLQPGEFDLHHLLQDVEDMFGLKAQDKQISLTFVWQPTLPRYLNTDYTKLRQVLTNLLSNAIKFTQQGGVTVRVTAEAFSETDSVVHLSFAVTDTGPGIPPAEISQLFEAFTQTSSGHQAREGTGLGLAISRRFVELLGGTLAVQTEVGQGSTFSFTIPIPLASTDASIKATPPTHQIVSLAPTQPTYRLLVVDNRWPNRQLLLRLLTPLGFEVEEAENYQQTMELWSTWQPHLIFMDIRMPSADGYEMTQHIKSQPQGQTTKIVALTATIFEEERADILAAGFDDFIRKPFREIQIFHTLETHLGVAFIYATAETGSNPSDDFIAATLTPERLSVLPPDLVTQMAEAAVRLDTEQAQAVIEQIRTHDAAIATALDALVYDFDYHTVATLFENLMTTHHPQNHEPL